ncbi:MAG: diguanylate cyclase [Labilithrix sp.]|nr:diguanylate cyclase [Labilithrix sp.]MCW5813132.1 diguanylate cyclase [Labilithrix sp.]
MERSTEEQVLGASPREGGLRDQTPTGVLLFLTLGLLLSLLALSISRGAYLRAVDQVTRSTEVKLTIAEARIAVDEARPDRAKEAFKRLHDLTADDARQQARADALRYDEANVRAVRIQLDVMRGDEDAALAVLEADARSKRNVEGMVLLFCTFFALAFAAAAYFVIQSGRQDMKRQNALLGSILDSIGDAVAAVDRDGKCVVVNAEFRRMFGVGFGQGQIGIDEAIRNGVRRVDGTPFDFGDGPFGRALRGEALDNLEVTLPSDGKERVHLSATSRPVRNERREVLAGVVVFRDVTRERNDLELLALQAAELQVQSLSDELTGLYNRRGFTVLSNQYARTAIRANRPFAILFCDLNGLKTINDTYGHEAGDDAIQRMAAVLKATFRESDIVARLGGDEYVALVDGADESSIATVLDRLRAEMDKDAKQHDTPYRLHSSTGAAFQPAGGKATIDELLTLADERMYSEKKTAKESRDGKAREEEKRAAALREAKLKEAQARLKHAQAVTRTAAHPPPSSARIPRPTPRAKA